MSKIKGGERKASKEQVSKIVYFLEANEYKLRTLWIADKVKRAVGDEKNLVSDTPNLVKHKLKK